MTKIPFGIASGDYLRTFDSGADAKVWLDNLTLDDPIFGSPLMKSRLFTFADLRREIEKTIEREKAGV